MTLFIYIYYYFYFVESFHPIKTHRLRFLLIYKWIYRPFETTLMLAQPIYTFITFIYIYIYIITYI